MPGLSGPSTGEPPPGAEPGPCSGPSAGPAPQTDSQQRPAGARAHPSGRAVTTEPAWRAAGHLLGRTAGGGTQRPPCPPGRLCPPELRAGPRAPQTAPEARPPAAVHGDGAGLGRRLHLLCPSWGCTWAGTREAGRRALPPTWRGRTRVCSTGARPAGDEQPRPPRVAPGTGQPTSSAGALRPTAPRSARPGAAAPTA